MVGNYVEPTLPRTAPRQALGHRLQNSPSPGHPSPVLLGSSCPSPGTWSTAVHLVQGCWPLQDPSPLTFHLLPAQPRVSSLQTDSPVTVGAASHPTPGCGVPLLPPPSSHSPPPRSAQGTAEPLSALWILVWLGSESRQESLHTAHLLVAVHKASMWRDCRTRRDSQACAGEDQGLRGSQALFRQQAVLWRNDLRAQKD